MDTKRIFVTRKLPEETLHLLRKTYTVEMWEEEETPCPRELLLEKASQASGLITMLSDKIDQELIKQSPHLQVVANLAVGHDNIDVEYAKGKNITVCNTPDVLTETTADLGFSLLMATARRIVEADTYVREDKWQNWGPFLMAGSDIHDKTLGIIGMGRIGSAVARRAKGFNMEILYHNRSQNEDLEQELGATFISDLKTLAERSDFVMCVVPLTPDTEGLLNSEFFSHMKSDGIFVNISRGTVVDEPALVEALESGQIKAAGLDVFASEPIRADHPLVKLDNVVLLPHIGSGSIETRERMAKLTAKNVACVLAGEEAITPL
ncbi:D-glycerate dehydrogenase [Paenalkalicoccus suaedae]|uniref:D-glycerate dehydrogenase n=1 Tax=Paenalkalicoccus suaedae TaxID=2592382 RepID=A0A859FIT4_9BACI|nr:D-glycerate dehydrogenase [Paenalkalicoccus suaedae]QKS72185.1 D-glycerate dehydrogenase [Paenalkalicoccus suaedae]